MHEHFVGRLASVDDVLALPRFSRGLKIVRLAVYAMLLQIAIAFVVTVKTFGADTPDAARSALDWMQYLLAAYGVIVFAMFIGVAGAIPEIVRVRLPKRSLVVSAIGFAIATAALAWSYRTIFGFVHALLDRDISYEEMASRAEDLKWLGKVAVVKDLAYSVALISLIGMVERFASFNDQISLRDEAGSMKRALIVMLLGDVFYQLTYGLGGSVGITGLVGHLLIAGYWIYCHIRLARFLFNAAWFVNEPHELPVATVIRTEKAPEPKPSKPRVASEPAARPSKPSSPRPPTAPVTPAAKPAPAAPIVPVAPPPAVKPVIPAAKPAPVAAAKPTQATPAPVVVVDTRRPSETPRAASAGESDDNEPRFLR
jgi:hypothetical protein